VPKPESARQREIVQAALGALDEQPPSDLFPPGRRIATAAHRSRSATTDAFSPPNYHGLLCHTVTVEAMRTTTDVEKSGLLQSMMLLTARALASATEASDDGLAAAATDYFRVLVADLKPIRRQYVVTAAAMADEQSDREEEALRAQCRQALADLYVEEAHFWEPILEELLAACDGPLRATMDGRQIHSILLALVEGCLLRCISDPGFGVDDAAETFSHAVCALLLGRRANLTRAEDPPDAVDPPALAAR
jgi:hypothetical protein